MIKFAVTRPELRMRDINYGLGLLKWKDDKYLHNYGLKINEDMVMVGPACSSSLESDADPACW